ncbi:MAG: preprotein translocase subunit YajC [Fusobacteriaceae bacterium]
MGQITGMFGKYGGMVLTFAVWIAIFYFLLILPNKKKQKKHREMVNSLQEGVEVISSGGIKGTVASVSEDYVVVRVDKGVTITFRKSAIATIISK